MGAHVVAPLRFEDKMNNSDLDKWALEFLKDARDRDDSGYDFNPAIRMLEGDIRVSEEIEKNTIVAYVKDDEDSGTSLIINLIAKDGSRWVGISVSKEDTRTAIMMPWEQWQEMVRDMMRR